MSDDLDYALAELEAAATKLQAGQVEGPEAAAVVQRCAELASQIAADLDHRSREVHEELPEADLPEQERLL